MNELEWMLNHEKYHCYYCFIQQHKKLPVNYSAKDLIYGVNFEPLEIYYDIARKIINRKNGTSKEARIQ